MKAAIITAAILLATGPAFAASPEECLTRAEHRLKLAADYQAFTHDVNVRNYNTIVKLQADLQRNFDMSKVTVSVAELQRYIDDYTSVLTRMKQLWQEHNDNVRAGCQKADKIYDEQAAQAAAKIEEGIAAVRAVLAYKPGK